MRYALYHDEACEIPVALCDRLFDAFAWKMIFEDGTEEKYVVKPYDFVTTKKNTYTQVPEKYKQEIKRRADYFQTLEAADFIFSEMIDENGIKRMVA